jgi:hypothetical protein
MLLELPVAALATATTAIAAATTTGSAWSAARSATTTRATGSAALFARAGFINLQGATLEIFAIQAIDGCFCLIFVRHLNETETTGLTGELVLDHGRCGYLTEFTKGTSEFILSGAERRISNIDIHSDSSRHKKIGEYPIEQKGHISGYQL